MTVKLSPAIESEWRAQWSDAHDAMIKHKRWAAEASCDEARADHVALQWYYAGQKHALETAYHRVTGRDFFTRKPV